MEHTVSELLTDQFYNAFPHQPYGAVHRLVNLTLFIVTLIQEYIAVSIVLVSVQPVLRLAGKVRYLQDKVIDGLDNIVVRFTNRTQSFSLFLSRHCTYSIR